MKGLLGRMGGIGISWLGVNWMGGVGIVPGRGNGVGMKIGRNDMEKRWCMSGDGGVIVLDDGLIIMRNRDKIRRDLWFILKI